MPRESAEGSLIRQLRQEGVRAVFVENIRDPRLIEQIAQLVREKKVDGISDIRDESDRQGMRIVIELRRDAQPEVVLNNLYKHTALRSSFNSIVLALVDGQPQVLNLKWALELFIQHRREVIRRRSEFLLKRAQDRDHIVQGLLLALNSIDEVIAIIREEDKPKPVLMERFGLSDIQAEAILELKLRHLAKLEEMKIRGEQEDLAAERDSIEQTLGSARRMKTLVRKELLATAEEFGDERRSPLVARSEAKAFAQEDIVSADPVTVVLSQMGWIRAAKGHDIDPVSLSYKSGDRYKLAARGKTNQPVVLLDSTGRSYSVAAHSLPSARGQGEPVTGRINPPSGVSFEGLMMGGDQSLYLMASDAGYGFIAQLGDLQSKNKAGKAALTLPKGAKVLPPVAVEQVEDTHVVAVTTDGRMLAFPAADLPQMARGKGNKMIGIPSARVANREEYVVAVAVMGPNDSIKVQSGRRHLSLKLSELEHYLGERGRRGHKLPRGFQKVDGLEVVKS